MAWIINIYPLHPSKNEKSGILKVYLSFKDYIKDYIILSFKYYI